MPLPVKEPSPKQVLVDVRDGRRIRVDAATGRRRCAGRHEPCEPSGNDGVDARLQDRIAVDHALSRDVEARAVQRVGHLADQPQRRVARQARVGVERDHVAHVGRHVRVAPADRHEGRVGRAAQQAVELLQLAALALPAHPRGSRRRCSTRRRCSSGNRGPPGPAGWRPFSRADVRRPRTRAQRVAVATCAASASTPVGQQREVQFAGGAGRGSGPRDVRSARRSSAALVNSVGTTTSVRRAAATPSSSSRPAARSRSM